MCVCVCVRVRALSAGVSTGGTLLVWLREVKVEQVLHVWSLRMAHADMDNRRVTAAIEVREPHVVALDNLYQLALKW